MFVFHNEVEIKVFEYDEEEETYYYPCPFGNKFDITKKVESGEENITYNS